MEEILERVEEHLKNGLHCSQVMLQLSLDLRQREEPFAIRALGALGAGMYSRRTCGTLTGGVCALSSYFARGEGEPEPDGYKEPARQLVEWFDAEFGSTECCDLVPVFDKPHIMEKCPGLMAKTFVKCVELLQEHGVDPYG